MKKSIKNVIRPNFKSFLSSALVVVLLSGCVTVNVNFPESAVQGATDDYVRDLYRSREQSKSPKASPSPSKTSSAFSFALINEAHADSVFSLSSSTTNSIKESMKARVAEVIQHKKEGYVGETNDGLVVLRGQEKLKPILKKKLEDLIQKENNDRKDLYSSIAKEKALSSENLEKMKKSFSRSFQAESPSGTWVQSDSGSWSQKP